MTLSVKDLHLSYNGRQVLRGLEMSLQQGEMVGILGINGAGKSTLLRCLNRILRPQKGAVLVEGRPLARMSRAQVARIMGYMPQAGEREPLTVFDAVLLGRRPHIKWEAGPRDLAVVRRVLVQMGLDELALRPVASLSGGEAQKVVMARALAQEPRLLLLDEPTSSLDLGNQLEVMRLISQSVRQGGLGAAVCLHDINLALRYLDRLVLLNQGRVHAVVKPGELTPQLVREVYGVEAIITQVAGQRVVVPLEPGPATES